MQHERSRLTFSPSNLTGFVHCPHLTELQYEVATGKRNRPFSSNEYQQLLARLGDDHEVAYLEALRSSGLSIAEGAVRTDAEKVNWDASFRRTRDALASGADVVFQAALHDRDGNWRGLADFLRKVDAPSALGPYSYEVIDTKLAREVKVTAVLQVCAYSDMLSSLQKRLPTNAYLQLGDQQEVTVPLAECMAYYRHQRRTFEAAIAERAKAERNLHYPEPVDHCDLCAWGAECAQRRRRDEHLSLVAFLGREHRFALECSGISTLSELADTDPMLSVPGLQAATIEKYRQQARLQKHAYETQELTYALLPPQVEPPNHGFAGLPEPTAHDLFFDIEADRWVGNEGLEYLFGFIELEKGEPRYHALWAHTPEEEKTVFEQFIDDVMARWQAHPNMHVYHYAPYEKAALSRLAGRYETREQEVDSALRGGLFIDLYQTVRQSLQASVESYSIKRFEPFYMDPRTDAISEGTNSVLAYEAWRQSKDPQILQDLEQYNEADCVSTWKLQGWLEARRVEAESTFGPISRPVFADPGASAGVEAETEAVRAIREQLLDNISCDPSEWSDEDGARVLFSQLLSWHRRESLSGWRRYYELLDMDHTELFDASDAIAGLKPLSIIDRPGRSEVHRYEYPPQDHKIKVSERQKPLDPFRRNANDNPQSSGTVVGLNTVRCTIDLRRSNRLTDQHPSALIPPKPIRDTILRDCVLSLGQALATSGFNDEHSVAWDILLRRPPRLLGDSRETLRREDETSLEASVRVVQAIDGSYLALQGPPGTGKTFTAGHMILSLLGEGKTVGVTGRSHRVISNLLDKAAELDSEGLIRGIQNAPERDHAASQCILRGGNEDIETALAARTVNLVGGTEWLFTRPQLSKRFDVLFVDEAGQMSLANALAASSCARNLVLVGDPQQLPQPLQGSHPPGADTSVLEHILEGEEVIRPDRGIFLEKTYRMHPDICEFVSDQFYRGELLAHEQCSRRVLEGGPGIGGTGIRFLAIDHTGCKTRSHPECEATQTAYESLIGRDYTDEHGNTHKLSTSDILVVAPYNSQVAALGSVLPEGARIGTVDKFQGQEAPVVFYSMTTSSPEDIPRGMEFLFSRNRLNVAISRAQCLAVIVGCPDLLRVRCRTLHQVRLANAVCAAVEVGSQAS